MHTHTHTHTHSGRQTDRQTDTHNTHTHNTHTHTHTLATPGGVKLEVTDGSGEVHDCPQRSGTSDPETALIVDIHHARLGPTCYVLAGRRHTHFSPHDAPLVSEAMDALSRGDIPYVHLTITWYRGREQVHLCLLVYIYNGQCSAILPPSNLLFPSPSQYHPHYSSMYTPLYIGLTCTHSV